MADVHEVELSAGSIRYRTLGEGPPVVFVHGFLVAGNLWDGVAERLAPHARCFLPDLPMGSHAKAMRPDADLSAPGQARLVAEFLEALDLEDVTLVGNDSGGAVCQIVVTGHPQRVGRLVLTPCDAFENFPPKLFRYLLPLSRSVPLLGLVLAPMRLASLRRLPIAYGWLTKERHDELTAEWVRPALADRRILRDAAKFIRGMRPEHTLRAADRLGTFDRPALVAWSADDRFFPVEHGRRLAELLPRGRFEVIPGARTFSALDQPARLADLIAGALPTPASA